MVDSFLKDRLFKVRQDDILSSSIPTHSGVPQGSCLSPTLYNIFTNDLPTTPNATVALFTDDTLLLTKNRNITRCIIQLQKQLDCTADWFRKWHFRLNAQKTVVVNFNQLITSNLPQLKIENHLVQWTNQAKNLGIIFEKDLCLNTNIREIIKKATRVRGMLYRVLNRNILTLLVQKSKFTACSSNVGTAWCPFISHTN